MILLTQFKIPFLSFLVGMLLVIFGAWMKIMHYATADYALTAGMIFQVVGVITTIYILVKRK